ncbi:MAG: hypothetical protein AAF371_09005 [Pseudomonadota bacterium]
MAEAYERVRRARSPLNVGLLLLGIAFGTFAAAHSAPLWFFIPVALFILPVLFTMLRGRDAHFRIDDKIVAWDDGWGRDRVALGDIGHVLIEDWSDSTDIYLVLHDGSRRRVSPVCFTGPQQTLAEAFAERGIRVEIR